MDKATLEHPKAQLYLGWNKDIRQYDRNRRVSVVYEDFVVVIFINRKGLNGGIEKAEFVTAYVADNSIKKIKTSPKWER